MPPESVLTVDASAAQQAQSAWTQAAVRLAAAWLALIMLVAHDWLAMVGQWWNSSTYNHILFVPPILAWLVWQRWHEVRQIEPRPTRLGLVALAMAVFIWLLGTFAGFDLLRQAGAVAMLPASALLLLGVRACAALLFPLSYMAFLVPFGDELVPPLQTITAKLTIALVHLSGVQAEVNGVFIDTPAGLFEVAEACSGVKFLVAMIALGTLVANIGFRSWPRRGWFMALCIVIPIVANGFRAWGTIFAAQYVGVEKAAGIDHIIYGWIFFALVIAAVLGISWRFFDRPGESAFIDPAAINADSRLNHLQGRSIRPIYALLSAAVLAGGGLAWSNAAQRLEAPLPAQIYLPDVPGWERVDYRPAAPWEPAAEGAQHRLLGSYADKSGRRVEVFYALYASQREGSEAGGFGQGALIAGGDWSWSRGVGAGSRGKGEILVYRGQTQRVAITWYRTGAMLGGSNLRLKLANIADRLFLRARPTAVLILSSEKTPDNDPQAALASFQGAIGAIGPWMDRIAEPR